MMWPSLTIIAEKFKCVPRILENNIYKYNLLYKIFSLLKAISPSFLLWQTLLVVHPNNFLFLFAHRTLVLFRSPLFLT